MPDLGREKLLGRLVAGIDEVGRGPLAGPVVAAAVILDPRNLPAELDGLDDSKALSAEARRHYAAVIRRVARIGVGAACVGEIDRLNILQATMLAMVRAVAALGIMPMRRWSMATARRNSPAGSRRWSAAMRCRSRSPLPRSSPR